MQAIPPGDNNFTESRLPLLTWRKFFQGQHFHMLKPSFLLHVLLYALRHPLLSVPVPRTQQHPANTSAYGQSWVYWLFSVDVIGKWHRDLKGVMVMQQVIWEKFPGGCSVLLYCLAVEPRLTSNSWWSWLNHLKCWPYTCESLAQLRTTSLQELVVIIRNIHENYSW